MWRVLSFLAAVGLMVPAATVEAQGEREEEARALFTAGRAAYDGGHYETAQARFQEAYELSGRAELLYNIGQSADRSRKDAEALAAFEQFLADTPADTPHRDIAERRVTFLRDALAADARPGGDGATPNLDPATMDGDQLALEPDGAQPGVAEASGGLVTQWWLWAIVAVVVIGAGVGVGLAVAGGDEDPQYAQSDIGGVIEALRGTR